MKKTALIIGNSKYENVSQLKNPTNDSFDIKTALEGIGFDVVYDENLSLKKFNKTVKSFSDSAVDSDILFFYYAGHGLQYNGENFLVPVDANIEDSEEISSESINLSTIENRFSNTNSKANIFILDSCRDNPFSKNIKQYAHSRNITPQINRGLANTTISISESLIAFATSPNEVALDNPNGRNGLFTKSLLKHINKENLTIQEILDLTGKDIVDESGDKQRPWIHNSIFKNKAILNFNKESLKTKQEDNSQYLKEIEKLKKELQDKENQSVKIKEKVIYKDRIVEKIVYQDRDIDTPRIKKEDSMSKKISKTIDSLISKDNQKVWQDPDTSLIWQVNVKNKRSKWIWIQEYVDKLNNEKYGGYNDWRVPTIDELKTILIQESFKNKKSYSGKTYIKKQLLESMNMEYQMFWSKSESVRDSAWCVDFVHGYDKEHWVSNEIYIRCVRNGQ